MPITANDQFAFHAPKPPDSRTMDFQSGASVPYASVAAAISAILSAYRVLYLPVWILAANGDPLRYWWQADLTDASLVPMEKESYTLNSAGSITLNPPYIFEKLVVIPTSNLSALTIGTTSGGGQLEPGASVNAGIPYSLTLDQYVNSPLSIFFGGVATGTKILVYKRF